MPESHNFRETQSRREPHRRVRPRKPWGLSGPGLSLASVKNNPPKKPARKGFAGEFEPSRRWRRHDGDLRQAGQPAGVGGGRGMTAAAPSPALGSVLKRPE